MVVLKILCAVILNLRLHNQKRISDQCRSCMINWVSFGLYHCYVLYSYFYYTTAWIGSYFILTVSYACSDIGISRLYTCLGFDIITCYILCTYVSPRELFISWTATFLQTHFISFSYGKMHKSSKADYANILCIIKYLSKKGDNKTQQWQIIILINNSTFHLK